MVNLSDLLVDKSLHTLGTDRRDVMVTSLIFMTSSIIYGIVMLTIEGVTSFLQLLDVQYVRKNICFSLNKLWEILTVCSRWRNHYRL